MPGHTLDLDRYLRIPRIGELTVSPDGRFVVFSAARPSSDGKRFVRDLHRAALASAGSTERLTYGDASDHAPRYRKDGSILFLSERALPERKPEGGEPSEPTTQLWLLPPVGEARPLTRRPASVSGFALGTDAGGVLFRAAVHPHAVDPESDRKAGSDREASGRTDQVFDALPIRFWDRFYGPRYEHLFHARSIDEMDTARDLTPGATLAFDDLGFDLSPDGRLAVASERERDDDGRFFENLRLFDLEAGTSRLLTSGHDSYLEPRFSPDGKRVVAVCHENVKGKTGRQWLVEVKVPAPAPAAKADAGLPRAVPPPEVLTRELDLWPESPVYTSDGRAVVFLADEQGHHPVFRVACADRKITRLTTRGSHADLAPLPDGSGVLAVAGRFDAPPEVVALDLEAPGRARPVTQLAAAAIEGIDLVAPESLVAKTETGREVQSWLLKPRGTPPPSGFPLLLWIHGGPLGAFGDGWHWRWNPQLFTAHGYAVLLVNPRISTGFGQDFIEEGFARWGGEPYDDLMAALDHALARPDLDARRTAAMGGSYGGYMANWIAGRTSRFRCIVSHAGLWHLPGFHGTTDHGAEWEREFGGDPARHPETYERWSPHRAACSIKTPVLVVHGEKDFRVPVSEGFQLFTTLQRLGVPSRLLYFPDENHWILRPPNIRAWHETIGDWLDRWLGPEPSGGGGATGAA